MAEERVSTTATGGQPLEQSWWRRWIPGVSDVERQKITAPILSEKAAGDQAQFGRAGFYDYLSQAGTAGREIAGQQQALADALRARAEGRGGPSIAEMQLQQTLTQNQRDLAGQLAATRGMNPASAQRLLAQQGANISQQAAGQGALLRAQEQLAAQQALGQQLGMMRGAEGQLFGQAGQLGLGQEKLAVETQEAYNQRMLEVALANQKADIERQRIQQAQEAQAYEQAAGTRGTLGKIAGGLLGGVGGFLLGGPVGAVAGASAGATLMGADGGMVPRNYADGGKVRGMKKAKLIAAHAAAKKNIKSFQEQYGKEEGKDIAYATMMKMAKENKLADGGKCMAEGGEVTLSPEELEIRVPRRSIEFGESQVNMYGRGQPRDTGGGMSVKQGMQVGQGLKALAGAKDAAGTAAAAKGILGALGMGMADGGKVNAAAGMLAKMDNKKNDVVPAMLSPGEIVLPRSIVNSPNPPEAAAKFVEALMSNKDKKSAKMEALKAALKKK